MARPTDYTPELVEKARDYVQLMRGTELVAPSIAGLALHLGIRRETCHVWVKEPGKEEFSNILEEVLALQEARLLWNGLSSKWNPTITKLMLTKHGYTDRTDVTSEGKALPTPILGAVTKDEP